MPTSGLLTNKKVWAICLVLIMVLAAVLMVSRDDGEESLKSEDKRPLASWTSFFWFCGDGNLGEINMMLNDIHWLEQVGSTDQVHMVGMLDKEEVGDARIVYINQGNTTEMPITLVNETWTDNEMNMGSAEELWEFLDWAIDEYPAMHYNLHLVNHGGGWRGMCWDEGEDPIDNLNLPEIEWVTAQVKEKTGHNVDVLSTEGCLVGMVEFGYQLRETTDFYVGGSTYGLGADCDPEADRWSTANWMYEDCWGRLVAEPTMTGEELALTMVDTFVPLGPYAYPPGIPKIEYSDVMAAYDLSKIEAVAINADAMAKELYSDTTSLGQALAQSTLINIVIGHPETPDEMNTESFSGQMDWTGINAVYTNYDLWDFAYQLSKPTAGRLRNAHAECVMAAVDDCVLALKHNTEFVAHPDAHGMSVYIPLRSHTYMDNYGDTDWAADTHWDDFLQSVYWA